MTQMIDSPPAAPGGSADLILYPGDHGWDEGRLAWNLAVDQHPAALALPRSAADVVAVVDHARLVGLKVAVQGTGHGAAPRGALDGTILLNMSRLQGVEIDPVARTARVAAGTLWLDVVAAAAEHGLTALHGSAQDVGVVGYSLGGGIGWLARKHGLSASSVLGVEIVTAAGELLRADADENPDLFWAIRGGGGNFGAVTAIEIALYPVAEAFAGWLIWPIERAAEVLGAWAAWTKTAPEEVTSVGRLLQIPPVPEMPEELRGRQLVVVEAAFLGDEASGRELLQPLLELEPEVDTMNVVPALALTELHQDPPHPMPGIGNGWLLDGFDAEAATAIVAAAGMDGTSPLLSLEIRHLGGAAGRPSPNGGALSHIGSDYVLFALGVPMGPVSPEAIEDKLDEVKEGSGPWDGGGAYFNFAERRTDPRTFYADGVYERLLEIRAEVDPDRLFRANHPIG